MACVEVQRKESQLPEQLIGYCHFCACKVTAKNLGISVIAARDPWCDKPECRKDALAWQQKYILENCVQPGGPKHGP